MMVVRNWNSGLTHLPFINDTGLRSFYYFFLYFFFTFIRYRFTGFFFFIHKYIYFIFSMNFEILRIHSKFIKSVWPMYTESRIISFFFFLFDNIRVKLSKISVSNPSGEGCGVVRLSESVGFSFCKYEIILISLWLFVLSKYWWI